MRLSRPSIMSCATSGIVVFGQWRNSNDWQAADYIATVTLEAGAYDDVATLAAEA
jgi:hypothetical protein